MEDIEKLHNELRDSKNDTESKNVCRRIIEMSKKRGISIFYAAYLVINNIDN